MKIECRHRLCAAVAVAVLGLLATGNVQARVLSQWVELGPDGSSSVRAITDDACPSVLFDGTPTPMAVRAAPDQKIENVKPAVFPVWGCEVAVPAGAVAAILGGKPLPLARPNRFSTTPAAGWLRAIRPRTATTPWHGRFRKSPRWRRARGRTS